MAWFQTLAGRAEDLLNKIDQNAATVLNEPNEPGLGPTNSTNIIEPQNEFNHLVPHTETAIQIYPDKEQISRVEKEDNVATLSEVTISSQGDLVASQPSESVQQCHKSDTDSHLQETFLEDNIGIFEKPLKLELTGFSSKSSQNNSFSLQEEQVRYEERIARLDQENQQLNKQVLNLQHAYSELQRENGNLQTIAERSQDQVHSTQSEMERYKLWAQRILHDKEKTTVKRTDSELDAVAIDAYNQELRKQLEIEQESNKELLLKIEKITDDIKILQQDNLASRNNFLQTNQGMIESLTNERKVRENCEEDCRLKNHELHQMRIYLDDLQNQVQIKENELHQMQIQLAQVRQSHSQQDPENRAQTLTMALMSKQNDLETVTGERNALKIQLERLEINYNIILNQKQKSTHTPHHERSENFKVPQLMEVSPFDRGVTRKVKHAYSSLDSVSIRTGAFLRRYPLARIFVFCYMILLHFWVMFILITYVPNSR